MKIPLSLPHIGKSEKKIALDILNSLWLTHGKYNLKFEKAFANYIGCKYAVSLNSCTSALEVSLKALGIKKGDDVVVPSFTWVSSANAIVTVGANPIFCDCDIQTRNVTGKDLEKVITKKTKALMIVHYGGQPCNMDEIIKVTKKYKIHLIEDSAETLGAEWKKKKTGSFGVGCFSFFPTKNITTGEGGMITSNDKKFINKCKMYIAHGIDKTTLQREKLKKNWLKEAKLPGHNFRLSNLLAGIGLEQLKKINLLNRKRINLAKIYIKLINLNKLPVIPPQTNKNATHVYQTFSVLVNSKIRTNLLNFLNKNQIGASVHFTPPVHLQKFYKTFKSSKNNLKKTEYLSKSIISLPLYPSMKNRDVEYIINKLKEYFKKNG